MVVMVAPAIAPVIVNISKYIATFTLVICSLTKDEAEPLEVAMMATIEDAIASLTGIPMKTSIGISMLAPPRPVRDPRNPTSIDIKPSDTIFNTMIIHRRKTWLLSVITRDTGHYSKPLQFEKIRGKVCLLALAYPFFTCQAKIFHLLLSLC